MTAATYLTLTTAHCAAGPVLRLRGELDAGNRHELRYAVHEILDRHQPQLLVLDLSALSFADCAGLAVITWAHQCQSELGHELVLSGAQPVVQRLLQLTGLSLYLQLRPLAPARPSGPA